MQPTISVLLTFIDDDHQDRGRTIKATEAATGGVL